MFSRLLTFYWITASSLCSQNIAIHEIPIYYVCDKNQYIRYFSSKVTTFSTDSAHRTDERLKNLSQIKHDKKKQNSEPLVLAYWAVMVHEIAGYP